MSRKRGRIDKNYDHISDCGERRCWIVGQRFEVDTEIPEILQYFGNELAE